MEEETGSRAMGEGGFPPGIPEEEGGSGRSPSGDMRVSLVATVLNEAGGLEEWWESILRQTRLPDELVVVDGGSSDGTVERLRRLAEGAPFPVRVEVFPGANIAQGRNRAISLASHPVIAVTDAGCVLEPDWLQNLSAPLRDDPSLQLVAGFYQPLARDWFEAVSACVTLPLPHEIRESRFMPSSRSLAFRKEVWERVGGYPEWLDIGEDMYFNHLWKKMEINHLVRREAVVRWRMRPDLPSLLRQYFLYARGDGESGMYPHRHLLRFSVYLGLAGAVSSRRGRLLPLFLAPALLYAGRRWRRIPHYLEGRGTAQKAAAVAAVPLLLASIDGAKMAGYLAGLLRRRATRASGYPSRGRG